MSQIHLLEIARSQWALANAASEAAGLGKIFDAQQKVEDPPGSGTFKPADPIIASIALRPDEAERLRVELMKRTSLKVGGGRYELDEHEQQQSEVQAARTDKKIDDRPDYKREGRKVRDEDPPPDPLPPLPPLR